MRTAAALDVMVPCTIRCDK